MPNFFASRGDEKVVLPELKISFLYQFEQKQAKHILTQTETYMKFHKLEEAASLYQYAFQTFIDPYWQVVFAVRCSGVYCEIYKQKCELQILSEASKMLEACLKSQLTPQDEPIKISARLALEKINTLSRIHVEEYKLLDGWKHARQGSSAFRQAAVKLGLFYNNQQKFDHACKCCKSA